MPSGRYAVEEVQRRAEDFSRGTVSRVSPLGVRGQPPALKASKNIIFRPRRAFSFRAGSRDSSAASLIQKPTSLGKFYSSSGNKLFVATDDGVGAGKLYRRTTASDTEQTLPWTPTDDWWQFCMANGVLVGCQSGGAHPPLFFSNSNAANTWLTMVLPKPVAAPTFNADSAGGSLVNSKTYFFRVRYRYANGSSATGPVSAGHTMAASPSTNLTINLIIPLPGAPRTDYQGWTLEATAQNGTVDGPFYFVADGTAATYTYAGPDSSLGYEADETLHGEPVAMDGVIFHRGRLFGWKDSNLYMSQPLLGEEGTGIFNWVGDAIFPVGKDDGDSIKTVELQEGRLTILKERSVYTLDGIDEDSFVLTLRYDGAGAAGPRSACSVGATIVFAAGDGRLFEMRGNAVRPMGADEVGDYLAEMDTTRDAEIVALNYLGDFILIWYVASGKDTPDDTLVYDLRFGVWSHFEGWPTADALVQKDRVDFNRATLIMADPTLRPPSASTSQATNPSFVVWLDKRNTSNYQIYAQKVNSDGTAAWTANGVQVSNSTGASGTDSDWNTFVVSDGAGGCIILWNDNRNGHLNDIYAQRLNAAGAAQWTAGGVQLESLTGTVYAYSSLRCVASDRAGGAIYVYMNANLQRVAQRVNASGAKQWAAGAGITLSGSTVQFDIGTQMLVNPDSSSMIFWCDNYTSSSPTSVRGQKLNSAGAEQWGNVGNGLVLQSVSPFFGSSANLFVCRDDAGGAIFTFQSAATDVFAQRINSSGVRQWGTGGVAVNSLSGASGARIVRDGASGCIVSWVDRTNTALFTMKVRRILSNGAPAYADVAISPQSATNLVNEWAVEDGNGGALFAWHILSGPGSEGGLLVNLVDGLGVQQFSGGYGVATSSTAVPLQGMTGADELVSDAAAGAIAFWTDTRTNPGNSSARNVFAARITPLGTTTWTCQVCTATGEQQFRWACFTDTPDSEYPPALVDGYHVWCGFTGTVDRAAVDGSGGDAIPWQIDTHQHDDGVPRYTKDWERIEVYVNNGTADIDVKVTTDIGATAALTLSAESNLDTWDDGSLWDDGSVWGTDGRKVAPSGLPKGTEGRKAAVTLSGNAREAAELGGFLLTGYVLPDEVMS